MKIENVDGIIWDLDGTLIDSFGIFEQIIVDVVQESGHQMPSAEEIRLNYHGSLEDTLQKILGIESPEDLEPIVKLFLDKQERHYAGDLGTHLFKDAAKLAQQAASIGIKQLIVTNRAHKDRGNASPKAIVAATVLADYIQEVRAGDEVSFHKPDKRSVLDWLEKHAIDPEKLLVIGDQFVDAQLALNIGARALLVKRNGEIPHFDSILSVQAQDVVIVDDLHGISLT